MVCKSAHNIHVSVTLGLSLLTLAQVTRWCEYISPYHASQVCHGLLISVTLQSPLLQDWVICTKSHPALLSIPERLLPSCLHEETSYNWHYYMQGTWKLTLAQGRLTYFYVGVVCKSFYLDVIKNELGISDDGNIIGNTVYKPIYQKVNDIYTFHEEKLSGTFGMKLLDINHYIPLLYLTPKQHKCPYKFRFIAGASKCYNKQLAIELSLALKCIKNHFKNYCKVIQKRTGISYYWSIDNSHEFINKIADIKTAHSIKMFDFSTLYTNLPLDVIYDSLRSLIIKMFVNSKSVAIMVNSNSKRAFWSNGSNYAGYREYTIDKLPEALELILFNTFIQFNGSIFKQILGIPMGGNASPFIADLNLSWCEYCYMTKVVKSDYTLAKLLSYNCRYLDDICTINLQNFGDIANDIYDNTLLLEGSTCSYKQDTFLDLYIRVVDNKFVTGIYHKVDDFNFEVISYPFPQSNVHSMLGYSTYYSQLIRFFRLCNNINDFLFRAKFSYSKLVKRGYKHNLLLKHFKKFCSAYNIARKILIYSSRVCLNTTILFFAI